MQGGEGVPCTRLMIGQCVVIDVICSADNLSNCESESAARTWRVVPWHQVGNILYNGVASLTLQETLFPEVWCDCVRFCILLGGLSANRHSLLGGKVSCQFARAWHLNLHVVLGPHESKNCCVLQPPCCPVLRDWKLGPR